MLTLGVLRASIVLAIVLGGCAVQTQTNCLPSSACQRSRSSSKRRWHTSRDGGRAAEQHLPLMCDLPAMAARMVADGNDSGKKSYQLYCSLSESCTCLSACACRRIRAS